MYKVLVKDNKIQNELPLESGNYYIQIFPEKAKTTKEFQRQLFSIIDEFCFSTGNSRYHIWGQYKDEAHITSSNEISLEKFPELLIELQFWLMQKL